MIVGCDHYECHVQNMGEAALEIKPGDSTYAMSVLIAAAAIVAFRGCRPTMDADPYEAWMDTCRQAWGMAREYDAAAKEIGQ